MPVGPGHGRGRRARQTRVERRGGRPPSVVRGPARAARRALLPSAKAPRGVGRCRRSIACRRARAPRLDTRRARWRAPPQAPGCGRRVRRRQRAARWSRRRRSPAPAKDPCSAALHPTDRAREPGWRPRACRRRDSCAPHDHRSAQARDRAHAAAPRAARWRCRRRGASDTRAPRRPGFGVSRDARRAPRLRDGAEPALAARPARPAARRSRARRRTSSDRRPSVPSR